MNSAKQLDETVTSTALRRMPMIKKLITEPRPGVQALLASKHQQTQMPKRRKHKKIRNKLHKVGSTAVAKQKKVHHVNALITKLESDNKALIEQIEQLKQLHQSETIKAYNEGLSAFAWWKDGIQYVGTCGVLLKDALK